MTPAKQNIERESTVTLAVGFPNKKGRNWLVTAKGFKKWLISSLASIRHGWHEAREIDRRIKEAKNEIFNKHYWKF